MPCRRDGRVSDPASLREIPPAAPGVVWMEQRRLIAPVRSSSSPPHRGNSVPASSVYCGDQQILQLKIAQADCPESLYRNRSIVLVCYWPRKRPWVPRNLGFSAFGELGLCFGLAGCRFSHTCTHDMCSSTIADSSSSQSHARGSMRIVPKAQCEACNALTIDSLLKAGRAFSPSS